MCWHNPYYVTKLLYRTHPPTLLCSRMQIACEGKPSKKVFWELSNAQLLNEQKCKLAIFKKNKISQTNSQMKFCINFNWDWASYIFKTKLFFFIFLKVQILLNDAHIVNFWRNFESGCDDGSIHGLYIKYRAHLSPNARSL